MNRTIDTAVILAGGESTRMGFDKQFLKIDGEYLIKTVAKKLSKYFEKIIIISNNPKIKLLDFDTNVSVYEDDIKYCGPLGGIYTALNKTDSDLIYVIACDMPNINDEYIKYLKSKIGFYEGVITKFGDWVEPFNGIYSSNIKKDIKKYLLTGRRNIFGFARSKNFLYIEESIARKYSPDWKMFDNLNTEKDLKGQNVI